MPPWNDGSLHTLSQLHRAQQPLYFYDGERPDSLPLELEALDREIDAFALKLQQQLKWVYQSIRFTKRFERFEQHTLSLAGPLLERRRQACQDMNASDRLCASFPPEIVACIFEFVVAGVQVDDAIPVPPQLSDTIRLASVTRSWRSLVLANPNLWVSFWLEPADPTEDDNGMRLSVFEQFLQRSGNLGLHIRLVVDLDWGDHFDHLVGIIRGEAHRIRTLHVEVARHTPADFCNPLDFPFPNADVVILDSVGLSLSAPRVSHLLIHVTGIERFRLHLPTITYLDLHGVCLYGIRVLLQAASTLRTLKVKVAPGTLSDVLDVTDQGDLTITSGSGTNANVTRAYPIVHDCLESLVTDEGDVLHTVTLPGLKSLCVWGDHRALARFLARSVCTLVRFGVDSPWSLESLTGMVTVQHLYVETQSLGSCADVFSSLILQADPASPNDLYSVIARLRTITACVDTRGRWTSRGSRPPYLFSTLVEFHHRYGGRLERLDLHVQDASVFADVWHTLGNAIPGHCPIRINGLLVHSCDNRTAFYSSHPVEKIGRNRLDYRDWAVFFCAQIQAMASRLFYGALNMYQRRRGGWGTTSGWRGSGGWPSA